MLVRLFEVRAEDLVHLVGDPGAGRRAPGADPAAWPAGTRCLEVALAGEERDPPASKAALGEQLARIWSSLLPGLIPSEPGLIHLLRLEAPWDQRAGLTLLSQLAIDNRRFFVSGGRRTRTREVVPPLTATLELTPAELADAIGQWGRAGGPELTIEIMTLQPEAAGVVFRADANRPISAGQVAQSLRLYMTGSRDRRSLFIISDHSADKVRLLLESPTGD